ncbi:MAG: hypothetical protein IPF99_36360 [Deltaproteobacteria bacterium]|nr:hypothetical protein [Deltaproteobacteria bacterium]
MTAERLPARRRTPAVLEHVARGDALETRLTEGFFQEVARCRPAATPVSRRLAWRR